MIEEAFVQVKRASELMEDAEVCEHLGDIYQVKGEFAKAKQAWKKALELEPERESTKEKLEKLKSEKVENVAR